MNALACRATAWFAHPWAIVLFPPLCGLWLAAGGSELGLTLVLSVFAITTTQLVLLAQDRDTKAIHARLAELVRAVPDAADPIDEAVLG